MSNVLVKVEILTVKDSKGYYRHTETRIVRLHKVDADINKLSANLKRELGNIKK